MDEIEFINSLKSYLPTEEIDQLNMIYMKQKEATNRTKRILDSVKREHSTRSIFDKKNIKIIDNTNSNREPPLTQRTLKKSKSKLTLIPFFNDDIQSKMFPSSSRGIKQNNNEEDDDFYNIKKKIDHNDNKSTIYSKIPHHVFGKSSTLNANKGLLSNERSNIKSKRSNTRRNSKGFVMPANPFGTVLEAREYFFFND